MDNGLWQRVENRVRDQLGQVGFEADRVAATPLPFQLDTHQAEQGGGRGDRGRDRTLCRRPLGR